MVNEYAVIEASQILQKWKATSHQIDSILPLDVNEKELQERCGLILQIDGALKIMFNNPDNINGFMKMPNKHRLFDGSEPLDFIEREGVAGLKLILKLVLGIASN